MKRSLALIFADAESGKVSSHLLIRLFPRASQKSWNVHQLIVVQEILKNNTAKHLTFFQEILKMKMSLKTKGQHLIVVKPKLLALFDTMR